MKYFEYINWILENPANFTFIHSVVDPFNKEKRIHIYQIYYTDPDTGRKMPVVCFRVYEGNDFVTDSVTGLEVANVHDINFKLFNAYTKSR